MLTEWVTGFMTAGDGDPEPLRVPRWISRPQRSSGDEPRYGSDDPEPAEHDADADPYIYVPRRHTADEDDEIDADLDFDDQFPVGQTRRPSWRDTLPSGYGGVRPEPEEDDNPRHGRRRAAETRNRRFMIAWIAAGLVILVALPLGVLFLSSDRSANVGTGGQRTLAPATTNAQPSTDGATNPGSTATASPTEVEPTGRSNAPAPNPDRFGPVTYEAETITNTLGGSASIDAYPGASGGSIVRNIGDWRIGSGPGTLRFQNVEVPAAGPYTLTFFHVNIDNERTRTAVITVDGVDPLLVTINGSSTCCLATAVRVTLKQGPNAITFSNNTAHAPSIDKITISQA
jgi:hypothetical protein